MLGGSAPLTSVLLKGQLNTLKKLCVKIYLQELTQDNNKVCMCTKRERMKDFSVQRERIKGLKYKMCFVDQLSTYIPIPLK